MEQNIFSPRLQSEASDKLSASLQSFAQGILILVFGLLPLFFIPDIYTSLGFVKTYFVILGVLAALVVLTLSILRSGRVRFFLPTALICFWLFVLLALVSGLLSGDMKDALLGNVLEIHTVGFFALMAMVMTVTLSFSGAKVAVGRLFVFLGIVAFLVQLFQILRLFLGPEFLAIGIFSSSSVSILGSFNDLAIYTGLVVIVSLVMIQQTTAALAGRIISAFLILSSLIILAVVNFYAVWLIVGFTTLLMILYFISKDTWLKSSSDGSQPVSKFVLGLIGFVCLISAGFIISGDSLGAAVSNITNVSYMEVRPSTGATLDITRSVWAENALIGVGPYRFEDAWRQYKDPVINQTIFWNTNFSAGSGYIPTLFITTGLAGGIAIILFFIFFLYLGYKTLFATKVSDHGWQVVGTISFLSAVYLWLFAFVYVPGVTILLLTALMTGLFMATYMTVVKTGGGIIDVTKNRQYGLLLITGVLMIIIASVLSTIGISKQFFANVIYADTVRSFQTGANFAEVDSGLAKAQSLYNQDLFVSERAQLRLAELRAIDIGDQSEQQRYASLLAEGISLAEEAIRLDDTNPTNYILLGSFYSLLDPAQLEGMAERTKAVFARAQELDPFNPGYLVLLAQYEAKIGDLGESRRHLREAIEMKTNYTDALFLLSQLDIQEGDTEAAIAVTRSIIALEPNNSTRYFQLGILLSTTQDLEAAVEAFEAAILLDQNYANARYFLALTYLEQDRNEEALIQLRIVEQSNPDNEELKALIAQVVAGEYEEQGTVQDLPIEDGEGVTQAEDVTVINENPETDLVTSVNNGNTTEEEVEANNQ